MPPAHYLEYALNWPMLTGPDFSVDELTALEDRAPPGAKVKWQNTRRFYEARRAKRNP